MCTEAKRFDQEQAFGTTVVGAVDDSSYGQTECQAELGTSSTSYCVLERSSERVGELTFLGHLSLSVSRLRMLTVIAATDLPTPARRHCTVLRPMPVSIGC